MNEAVSPLRLRTWLFLAVLLALAATPGAAQAAGAPLDQARALAAEESRSPTTAENVVPRFAALQDVLRQCVQSGAGADIGRIAPPQAVHNIASLIGQGRRDEAAAAVSAIRRQLADLPPGGRFAGPGSGPSGFPPMASSPPAGAGPPPMPPGAPNMAAGAPGVPGMPVDQSGELPPPPRMPVAPMTVTLPTSAATATVTESVPRAATGGEVLDFSAAFPARTVAARAGRLELTLTDLPVYVETGPAGPGNHAGQGGESPFGAAPATWRGETPPFGFARDIGLGWHRESAFWVENQPEADLQAGRFQFARLDGQLAAQPRDMETLLSIMLVTRLRTGPPAPPGPGFAAPGGAALGAGAPGARPAFALATSDAAYRDYLLALVNRYGTHSAPGVRPVRFWQFENELDLSPARFDAAGYAQLMELTYQTIKGADPRATVLMGGASGKNGATNVERFYLPVLRLLHGQGMDAFDMHFYGFVGDYKKIGPMYASVRQALDATGFSGIPVWMTETGTYSGRPALPPGAPLQSEQEQAGELVRRSVYCLGLGIKKVFWALLKEGFHYRDDLFDHSGLVTDARVSPQVPAGTRKLGFFAYKLLCDKLAGCWLPPTRLDLGPNVFAYAFARPGGGTVTVVWADPR